MEWEGLYASVHAPTDGEIIAGINREHAAEEKKLAAANDRRSTYERVVVRMSRLMIETGAVSHSRAARSVLPAGRGNGHWKGKRQGDVLGLGYRV